MGLLKKKKQEAKRIEPGKEVIDTNPIEDLADEANTPEEPIWKVEKMTVETQDVLYNTQTKKVLTIQEALVELLNRTEE